ncbi:MAG: helix-turn-helix transcriptional regulator [Planctomycetota bacterium]
MSDLEQRMIEAFRDREYRESYAEGFLNSWISHQLTAVRRQRGLTQQQLAERVGTKQSGISRMERDGYGRWNFSTLQKAALALDCRLKVSLETFGSLLEEAAEFSETKLLRPVFEQDPVFHSELRGRPSLDDPGPVGEMRRKLLPWLWNRGPLEKLAEWLQGYDLPPVGDEVPPSQWLLDALRPDEQALRTSLAERLSQAILRRRWDVEPPPGRQQDLVRNLLNLAEGLRSPAVLGDAVWTVYQRRPYVCLEGSKKPAPGHPLVGAAMYNQPNELFRGFWTTGMLAEREVAEMPEYAATGLLGMSHMPVPPNAVGIVEGADEAKKWSLGNEKVVGILRYGFRRVWSEFPSERMLTVNVILTAGKVDVGWSEPILVAWKQSVPGPLPTPDAKIFPYMENVVRIAERSRFRAAP